MFPGMNPLSSHPRSGFPSRALLILGLLGAVIGLVIGIRGALAAHEAVSEVNRKGGEETSLFRADRLDTALDKVRSKIGADGKLLQLDVYPGYLMVDASAGSEETGRAFKVQANGQVDEQP